MGLIKKIAVSAGKKVSEEMAKKAVKKILGSQQKNSSSKNRNDSADEDFVSSATNFLKQAGKEFSSSDVANIVDFVGLATGTSTALGVAKFAGKTFLDVNETKNILDIKVKTLRNEGKITQDILDAILCENKYKLALAYREAIRAEAMGQPLKYLSEDEVDDALGFRTRIAKALTHKFS